MKIKSYSIALISIFVASGATKTSCASNENLTEEVPHNLKNGKYKSGEESSRNDFSSKNKKVEIATAEINRFSDAVKHINLVEYSLRQFADLFSDADKQEFRYLMSRILKDPKNFRDSDLKELKNRFEQAFKNIDPKLSDAIRIGFMNLKDFVNQSETPKFYNLFSAIYLAFNGDAKFKNDEELQKALTSFSEKFFDMCAKISPNDIKSLSEKSNKALTQIVEQLSKIGGLNTILNDKDKNVMNDVLELLQMLTTVSSDMNNEQEIGDKFAKKFAEIIDKIKKNIEELEKAKDSADIVTDPDRLSSYIGDGLMPIAINGANGTKLCFTNEDGTKDINIELKDLKKLTILKNTSKYKRDLDALFAAMDKADGCTSEELIKAVTGSMLDEYISVVERDIIDPDDGTKYIMDEERAKKSVALLSGNGKNYLVMLSGDPSNDFNGRNPNNNDDVYYNSIYSLNTDFYNKRNEKYKENSYSNNTVSTDYEGWFSLKDHKDPYEHYFEQSTFWNLSASDIENMNFCDDGYNPYETKKGADGKDVETLFRLSDLSSTSDLKCVRQKYMPNAISRGLLDFEEFEKKDISKTTVDSKSFYSSGYSSTTLTPAVPQKFKFKKSGGKGAFKKMWGRPTKKTKDCNLSTSTIIKRGDGKKIKVNGHELDQVTIVRNDGRIYIKELEKNKIIKDGKGPDNLKLNDKKTSLETYLAKIRTDKKEVYTNEGNKVTPGFVGVLSYNTFNDKVNLPDTGGDLTHKELFELLDALRKDFLDTLQIKFNRYKSCGEFSSYMNQLTGSSYQSISSINSSGTNFWKVTPYINYTGVCSRYKFDLSQQTFAKYDSEFLDRIDVTNFRNVYNSYKNNMDGLYNELSKNLLDSNYKNSYDLDDTYFRYENNTDIFNLKLDCNLSNIKNNIKNEIKKAEKIISDAINNVKTSGITPVTGVAVTDIDNYITTNKLSKNFSDSIDKAKKNIDDDIITMLNYKYGSDSTKYGTIQKEMNARKAAWDTFRDTHLTTSASGVSLRNLVREANADIELLYKQYLEMRYILLEGTNHTREADYSQLMYNILGNTRMNTLLSTITTVGAQTVKANSSTNSSPNDSILYTEADIDKNITKCDNWHNNNNTKLSILYSSILKQKKDDYDKYNTELDNLKKQYCGDSTAKGHIFTKIKAAQKDYEKKATKP